MTSTIIHYTEDDVKNMTNQELVIEFDKVEFGQRIRQSTLIKKNPILFNEIRNRTLFLDDVFSQKNIQVPILSRIFCLDHNIIEYPKCKSPTCDNLVSWNSSKFCDYCCRTCSNSSPDVQNKKKSTCNKNFGVDNPFQSLQVRNIAKETFKNSPTSPIIIFDV